jgi:hypothetical protein
MPDPAPESPEHIDQVTLIFPEQLRVILLASTSASEKKLKKAL